MIFTCGHSTRSFKELTDLLQSHGVTLLVDVRAIPKSRFYPWFNRTYLEKNLPVKYLWRGDCLGGKNADLIPPQIFEAGIRELVALSATATVCIMCSERVPGPTRARKSGCHRWFSLTPALQKHGVEVVHI